MRSGGCEGPPQPTNVHSEAHTCGAHHHRSIGCLCSRDGGGYISYQKSWAQGILLAGAIPPKHIIRCGELGQPARLADQLGLGAHGHGGPPQYDCAAGQHPGKDHLHPHRQHAHSSVAIQRVHLDGQGSGIPAKVTSPAPTPLLLCTQAIAHQEHM